MRFTKTTLAGTAMMGLLAVGAPAAQAAETGKGSAPSTASASAGHVAVSASAHIRYTVKGYTATVWPYVTGTQHLVETPEGVVSSSVLPMSFGVTIPKGVTINDVNTAGDAGAMGCTDKGSTKLTSDPLSIKPMVLTFAKPGTYRVSLDVVVCGDGTRGSTLKKAADIVIPAKGSTTAPTRPGHPRPGHTSTPSAPVTHAPSRPGTPATQTPTGPKVQTDGASSSDGTRDAAVALGLLGVGGAALGARGLRRR